MTTWQDVYRALLRWDLAPENTRPIHLCELRRLARFKRELRPYLEALERREADALRKIHSFVNARVDEEAKAHPRSWGMADFEMALMLLIMTPLSVAALIW